LGIRLMSRCTVTGVDAPARRLQLADGELPYQELVLAVGASQRRLTLPGTGANDILTVNHLDDYAQLRERLAGKRRVAIIGAGLIGCEFANDLRLGGYEVELFDAAPLPLARLLPPFAAERMARALADAGIGLRMSSALKAIELTREGHQLVDQDDRAHGFDLVISAIGLQPNLALAHSAGIETRLGIVANACLGTSDAHIHALGDCVEVDGQVLPYVLPIMHQAKVLAAKLTGSPTPIAYPLMPIVIKTPACPTVICPPPVSDGQWEVTAMDTGLRAIHHREKDAAPTGFVLQGECTRERQALAAALAARPALSAAVSA
jgi:rubredoxin-NAD+ reductase